ncbi:MAG: hypothetical protein H7138_26215, partial [Myxococcales bacterium]|nr:hypothetical protein [Myxococcales bacterium]
AQPPDAHDDGPVTSLSTRRALATPLTAAALERITRELDRLEGRRGKVVRLGASLTWSTPALEVHVDPVVGGTQLLVWRRMSWALRLSSAFWMLFGLVCGALGIAIAEGCGMLQGGFEMILIFVLLGGGAYQGLHFGYARHARALPARRAQLDFIADRLVLLASGGDQPPYA